MNNAKIIASTNMLGREHATSETNKSPPVCEILTGLHSRQMLGELEESIDMLPRFTFRQTKTVSLRQTSMIANLPRYLASSLLCVACLGQLGIPVSHGQDGASPTDGLSANEIFQQRIMPIFNSPNPSSCVQCHLSGVDLKDYVLPSHEKTFLALRDAGLINIKEPELSKILHLISMGENDEDRGAQMLHAKTRQAEYEAFATWITACCRNDELVTRQTNGIQHEEIGPKQSNEVIRHSRKDRLLASFERNIWSLRMRCFPCHTPYEIDDNNPEHLTPKQRHSEYVQQFGERMNIFKETPQQTLKSLMASSAKPEKGHLPLVSSQNPEQSLLLLKPIAKVPGKDDSGNMRKPSYADPVTHGGGIKMHIGDDGYKAFITWLTDYAEVTNGGYETASELPTDNWTLTQHVVRIKDCPPEWPAMAGAQIFVYRLTALSGESDSRSETNPNENLNPIAFTQGIVTPRGLINGSLFLIESAGEANNATPENSLSAGKYAFRICIDFDKKLQAEPTKLLDPAQAQAVGEFEVEWKNGFANALILSKNDFKEHSPGNGQE
ncbi:MAG: hypothetical protein KDB03_27440 [Planctomycetales bacterium]|nr:hypothetical protein [Planctomycetales bacterium]